MLSRADGYFRALVWNSTFWTSPLIVDGHVYCGTENGDMKIFELSKTKNLVAEVSTVGTLHAASSALRARLPARDRLSPSWASRMRPMIATGTNEIAWSTSAAPTARSFGAP